MRRCRKVCIGASVHTVGRYVYTGSLNKTPPTDKIFLTLKRGGGYY